MDNAVWQQTETLTKLKINAANDAFFDGEVLPLAA
jgi:hypothetical protein